VTRPTVPATQDGQEPGVAGIVGTGIGRAAALIAGLTILARLLGLVRTIVFAKTVGATCLGTAYVTANALPNIIYDVVLGGALTSIMVPVLARPARRSPADEEAAGQVRQISSALLTWTILILVPVSLAIALLAEPLATVLNPVNSSSHCAQAPLVTVTGHMLAVFAPQILLYGLAVVLYGILQAHRKFAAPALAPVISSLVLIAIYIAFVPLGAAHVNTLGRLSTTAELTLSVGTTVGVAALLLTALIPAWRLRLGLRPALRFPAGVGRQVGGLALFGIVALVAQDLAQLVVILLANGRGPHAAFVLYQYGWQVFEAAYAVLAISIAVSAFPVLSARDGEDFDQTASGSARAVLLMSFLGTALMFAVAIPAAHFLAAKHGQIPELAVGLALFAPGLAGYGLVACLSRVLLAARHTRVAAIAVGGGWLVVVVTDIVLVGLVPGRWVVGMLALGSSIGLTAAGIALVVAVRRALGPAALAGTGRAAAAGLAAAVTGGGVGTLIAAALPISNPVAAALVAAFAAGCAVAVFALVAYALDGGELRAVVSRVRQALAR
jgi:putative peptidoglycan lipid II flippase